MRLSVTGLPIQSIKIDATSPPARSSSSTSKGIGAYDIIVMHLSTGEFTERKVAGLVVAAVRSQRYALLLFASVHRETSDDDGNS